LLVTPDCGTSLVTLTTGASTELVRFMVETSPVVKVLVSVPSVGSVVRVSQVGVVPLVERYLPD
jgi:hypothetical protein